MTSNLLGDLGLGNIDIGLFIVIFAGLIFILLIALLIVIVEFGKLKKRYLRFTQGRDSKSLEKEIGDLFKENASLKDLTDKNRRDIRVLYKRMEPTFQKVGLVKYDAFPQMGGKLSFSLAMLDEKNNGYILNSVHGSDGCYTYLKEIKLGACELTLGEEEKKALGIAMQN